MPAIAATATAPRTAPPEPVATTTRAQRHRCERHDDEGSDGARRAEVSPRRGNPLVSAMMAALKELMPAAAGEAKDGEALKDSAMAFAHELVDALRGTNRRALAPGHAHHHHRHGGDRHGGYDSLAQRLDRLAAQVDAPAAVATGTTTISASLSSASFSASVDGDTASASLSLTALQIDVTQQTGTAAAAESPLQAAFRKLFEALQPASAPGTPAADASASSLSSFLRQLASALRDGDTGSAIDAPSRGGLLSLAA